MSRDNPRSSKTLEVLDTVSARQKHGRPPENLLTTGTPSTQDDSPDAAAMTQEQLSANARREQYKKLTSSIYQLSSMMQIEKSFKSLPDHLKANALFAGKAFCPTYSKRHPRRVMMP